MADIHAALKASKESTPTFKGVEKPIDNAVKLPTPKKDNTWNKKFQPLIDANVGFGTQFNFKPDESGKKIDGWDDLVNYSNSLPMMKAVNGRYDAYLNKSDISDKSKQIIKDLKNASWAAMNEIEKISKGTGSMDKFLEYQKNALVADNKLVTAMGPNTKSNYVYDPDKKTIVDKATFSKNYQGIKTGERGSTQTNVGGGGVDPYAGYIQTKGYLDLSRTRVKDQVKPLVSNWGKNAYNYLNADDSVAGRIDPDNRSNTMQFSEDALTFISKYGTQSGNKEYDKENKTKAQSILNKYKALGRNEDPKVGRDAQLKYLKQLTNGKTNQLADMIDDMGYYGSVYMYKKHKDILGKNSKYYEGAEKYIGKLNDIDDEISSHEVYAQQTKTDRLQAKKESIAKSELGGKELIFNAIIDKGGNIQSYHQFIKNLGPNYKIQDGLMGSYKTQTKKDYTDYVYAKNKGFWDANPGTLFYDDEEFNETMRATYNDAVKQYKQRFSLLNDPKKREKDMGRGNTADQVLYYDYVDMSMDKDGNLINTDGEKGNNVAKIYGMFQNQDKTINTKDITILNNDDLKSGRYSKASKETLDSDYLKDKNENKFNNFFKGKDLSQMYVEFDRNSSVPYRSTYTFVNQKTGEKLSMIAPVDYIKKNKETIHAKTWMTVPEARFQRLGKLDLPDVDNVYKNAAIIQKNGIKYATYQFKDTNGVYKREEIPIGDVQIEVAKTQFLDYFKRLQEIENKFSNLND